jgi:RNA polymerase sigma factor (sigma-70 family)
MGMGTSPVLRLIRRIADNHRVAQLADAELLRDFSARRDGGVFRALVSRHGAMVFNLCRSILGNDADAEDAFQATFLILAQKAQTIRKRASVGSWLYGVAYRTACRARADRAKRHHHETSAPRPAAIGPSDDLTWREVRAVLHEEISKVSDCYRAPLLLCYLEGKTQDEAARELRVSKDTVKKRLDRARALLRKRLLRRGLGPVAVVITASWPLARASAMPGAGSILAVVRAATLIATKETMIAGLISVRVAALSRGVLKSMFLFKLSTMAAGFLVASLLAVGTLLAGSNLLPEAASEKRPAIARDTQTAGAKAAAQEATKQAPIERRQAGLSSAVRQALEANAGALAPVALTIEKQRSFAEPESKKAKDFLRDAPGFLKPCTYEYLAQDGLCYARHNAWSPGLKLVPGTKDKLAPDGSWRESWHEFSWDGKCGYLGAASLHPKILEIVPIEKLSSDGHFKIVTCHEPDDYLAMTGITVPGMLKDLAEGRRSEVLRLLEGDGRVTATATETLPGQATPCLVLDLHSNQKKTSVLVGPRFGLCRAPA